MKYRLIPIVAVFFAAAMVVADPLADFKKWYMKGLPVMVKAMEGKNIGFFEKASTKDFTYTEASGKKSDKKTAIAGLKQMFDSSEKVKLVPKVGAIQNSRAGITVDLTNRFEMITKPGPDKKTHKMVMVQKNRELWVNVDGKWLLKNIADVGPAKSTMDGKPMPAGAMGGG